MRVRYLSFLILILVLSVGFRIAELLDYNYSKSDFLVGDNIKQANASEHAEKKPESPVPVSAVQPKSILSSKTFCNEAEIKTLQNLAKKREDLAEREKALDTREEVINSTDTKLQNKIDQITILKKQVEDLLESYNKKEDQRINSLVKIYETMKPKDAAAIFEKLDMEVTLEIINKMKESKIAPILGKMNPESAEKITKQFAEQRKIMENQINSLK